VGMQHASTPSGHIGCTCMLVCFATACHQTLVFASKLSVVPCTVDILGSTSRMHHPLQAEQHNSREKTHLQMPLSAASCRLCPASAVRPVLIGYLMRPCTRMTRAHM
jgi:hypothetical protein